MRFLNLVGTSFGCSASGERLVSAARDGDLQEAKALLECNPRLARYSTFGVRNSPLHYSAARGHHEIVFLLLESGVDVNSRNARGQTALMQACRYGHWEVVQMLMLFKANIHKVNQLNGATALHFAAINGHTRCIRLLMTDLVPSLAQFWNIMRKRSSRHSYNVGFDVSALPKVINQRADGGVTALHMAALHGYSETVQLLLDLGACVSLVTVEDGTTIDLIGAGSSPLHYAACGGNARCCQLLISRGASLTAKNSNGRTPLMVAVAWNKNCLEGVLTRRPEGRLHVHPSPYLALPLMSIMNIARECGLRCIGQSPGCFDPCVVCLERRCTVAAEGCGHEFCTRCALNLSSMSNMYAAISGPPGSIACPLCRHAVVSFVNISSDVPRKGLHKNNFSLTLCSTGLDTRLRQPSSTKAVSQVCTADLSSCIPSARSASFRSSRQKLSSAKFSSGLCMGLPETCPTILRCSGSKLQRSASDIDSRRSRLLPLNQREATAGI